MFSTGENQKISIILVLSITTLAAVLVTGTVVNIVSAANSVNVQPKTNQRPVTSTGRPHIVSSTAHGSVSIQPNQHHVIKTLLAPHTKGLGQCWNVLEKPPPPYGIYIAYTVTCPAEIPGIHLFTKDTTINFWGKLLGWKGSVAGDVSGASKYYEVDNAHIEIKVVVGKDKHLVCCQPSVLATTGLDGTFSGTFTLCDDPKYSDHGAILTAYLVGPSGSDTVTIDSKQYPGPYLLPVESSLPFGVNVCPSMIHFTDMHITSNPNYDFTFSGKLMREGVRLVEPLSALQQTI